MTTYTWPNTRACMPGSATLRVVDNTQRVSESALSGDVQTTSMPGARWGWDWDFSAHTEAERQDIEARLLRMSGREHRVRLWDHKHPAPRGTISLSGVTLAAAAPQFATTAQLAGCGAGATMLAGAWLAFGGQLVRTVTDAVANGSGVMDIEFRHMLRQAVASGAAVTLQAPTALYIRTESGLAVPRAPGRAQPGFTVQWLEVFA